MLDLERQELEALAVEKNGKLHVDDVVRAAQNPDSALHRHFTWDNKKAAAEYRRVQARSLIARIRITVLNPDPVVVRAFVSLAADRNGEGGYTATADVLNDEAKRGSLIDDILRRVAYWREQSRVYASAELRVAIERLEATAAQEVAAREAA